METLVFSDHGKPIVLITSKKLGQEHDDAEL
jgi:hypothetical protein